MVPNGQTVRRQAYRETTAPARTAGRQPCHPASTSYDRQRLWSCTRSHRGDHRPGTCSDRLLTATSAGPGPCRGREGSSRIRTRTRASAGSKRCVAVVAESLHRRRTPPRGPGRSRGRPERPGDPAGAAGVNGVTVAVICGDALDQEVPLSWLALPQNADLNGAGPLLPVGGHVSGATSSTRAEGVPQTAQGGVTRIG